MTKKKSLAFFVAVLICSHLIAQNNLGANANAGLMSRVGSLRTADEGMAAEEFRRGVQAYYRGSFNEAILQFERALSYIPDDNLIMDWLGKANYRAGLEGAALSNWKNASEDGYGGILLQNKIEIVSERRVTGTAPNIPYTKYTEAGSFDGVHDSNVVFNAPSSVLPNSDGSFWITAYGSNEILRIDMNGNVLQRSFGPYTGFDRPLDIIRLHNGNIAVTESAGDRVTVMDANGRFVKYIGQTGRGNGQCVGPQYAAEDTNGNIFVTDYGNKRVVVFDRDGNGLFTFGKKNTADGFDGFSGPSGIAVVESSVFVADSINGAIYEFDSAGNYIRHLVEAGTFSKPESMKVWGGWLIVCDTNKIFSVDCISGAITENARTGNAPTRLTSAVPDVNGNILVTDFRSNEIYVMTTMQELIGGFFVQINRVNADKFPTVTLEVQIENRNRQPVVGLDSTNFFITENGRQVSNQTLLGAVSNNNVCDITLVLDRSVASRAYHAEMETAVREIAAAMNGRGTLRIVAAGRNPTIEFSGNPRSASEFRMSSITTATSDVVAIDAALRLAANDLINGEPRRAIVYITSGSVTPGAFSQYGLSDIAAYLNNNSISMSVVQLAPGSPAEAIAYFNDAVRGDIYYVYRAEGLSSVVRDVLKIPVGIYQFSYTSSLTTNFGEAYLPVEIETYLMNRSGRDETGYFAPLQ